MGTMSYGVSRGFEVRTNIVVHAVVELCSNELAVTSIKENKERNLLGSSRKTAITSILSFIQFSSIRLCQ